MPFLASLLIALLGPLGFFLLPSHPKDGAKKIASSHIRGVSKLPLAAELLPQVYAPYAELSQPDVNAAQSDAAPPAQFAPYRDWAVPLPDVDAKAAVVIGEKSGKVLYERTMREKRPIASLTKLATALAAADELSLDDIVTVSRHAVSAGGDFGNLAVGEQLAARDLLRAMLIASSNDAAVALAEHIAQLRGKRLTELMNAKAYALELAGTHFASVSGLEDTNNYATAEDIAHLFSAVLQNTVLADMLKTTSVDIRSTDGKFTHRLVTSNKLLNRFDSVVAGKTGYTQGAGGCLAVLAKNNHSDDDFLVVVLGSTSEETRFDAAEKLISWVNAAYRW